MNIKKIFSKFPRLSHNPIQKIAVILGCTIFFFFMWQINLMTADYATSVWNTLWTFNVELFPNMTFGVAYDLSQLLQALGFILAILGLWFWED